MFARRNSKINIDIIDEDIKTEVQHEFTPDMAASENRHNDNDDIVYCCQQMWSCCSAGNRDTRVNDDTSRVSSVRWQS